MVASLLLDMRTFDGHAGDLRYRLWGAHRAGGGIGTAQVATPAAGHRGAWHATETRRKITLPQRCSATVRSRRKVTRWRSRGPVPSSATPAAWMVLLGHTSLNALPA